MNFYTRELLMCALLGMVSWVSGRAQDYQFSTLAGAAGQPGTNDGPASLARFRGSSNLLIDPSGVVFIADNQNHTIRKMVFEANHWTVTTIAGRGGDPGGGDGTNDQARFYFPHGIALDESGNLYVADHNNNAIRQLVPVDQTNWVVRTIAGLTGVAGVDDGFGTNARFWGLMGMAVTAGTNLFVLDGAAHTIRHVRPSGTDWEVSTIAGTAREYGYQDGPGRTALLNFPYGVTVSRWGDLFITEAGNHGVRQLTQVGQGWSLATIAGGPDSMGSRDGPGAVAQFNFPNGIAEVQAGVLLVADQSNNTIRRLVMTNGQWMVSTIGGAALKTGSADGVGADARFFRPWDIAVDQRGNLLITDQRNHTIRLGQPLIAELPLLELAVFEGAVSLSWPAWATNFVLEMSEDLDSLISWVPLTNGVTPVGGRWVLSLSPPPDAGFFRLRQR
jgi:DNA-binding beta-propeller fold protein YncE